MKKVVLVWIGFVLMMGMAFANEVPVKIELDGVQVEFNEDYGFPFIDENGRTQVPLRKTMETFGAEVSWDGLMNQALISFDGSTIEVPIGKQYIIVNGERVNNDTEAVIMNGRTFLPIRVVLEALNAEVEWENDTRTVVVTKGQEFINLTELDKIPQGLDVGKRAYNIALKDIEGNPFNLYDLVGKNVVLAFWTTWCPACNLELDNLVKFNDEKASDTVVVSVNLTASDSEKMVKEFIDKKGIDFTVLMDRDNKVAGEYELVYIPALFVLDKRGVIVESKTGAVTNEKLLEIIANIEN